MRGPARFSFFRSFVTALRSVFLHFKTRRYEKELLAELDKSIFRDVDHEKFLNDLRRNGCSFGLRLPENYAKEIIEYAEKNELYAFRKGNLGFKLSERKEAELKLNQEILLAQYFNVYKTNTTVKKIANDPFLKLIALKYLKSVPKFLGVNLWWTFPVTPSPSVQKKHAHFFHRDIDDFKFLKFFFYLTDVKEDDGAHWLVLKSHKHPPHIALRDFFFTRRFTDQEISNYYEEGQIKEVTAPKYTGFAEDTLCVHKAATPKKDPRLILHIQFGLFNFVPKENDERELSTLQRIL